MTDRITGNCMPYSFWMLYLLCKLCRTQVLLDRLCVSSLSKKTIKSNNLQMSLQRQHFLLIPWLKKIIWVIGVLRRTVVSDWSFDNLCGSHLQSQVVVLVSWKLKKNPGDRFDWSVDRVAVSKWCDWLWRHVQG